MKIAFFGDTHGQAYHLLAAVITWQERFGVPLDMVIQVGDFGAERLEMMIQNRSIFLRYPANDPAQFDFLRILYAKGELAQRLQTIRKQLTRPIYFLRGNHDELAWLRTFSQEVQSPQVQTVPIDPYDLFHYLPDGTILECDGMQLAIFGGVERRAANDQLEAEHDPAAFAHLLHAKPGKIDVLITHDPPYGIGTGFRGQVFGSTQVNTLVKTLQPRYHLAGHLHTMIGPKQYDATTYLGLAKLGSQRHQLRLYDASRTVQPGTMAILDTETGILEFVVGDWLADFSLACESIVEPLATCLY